MRKAFTLTELIVAVGLLVALITVSGSVFNSAIEAHRHASATSEIMRTFRAITDQLNRDFAGIRTDAPIAFHFQESTGSPKYRKDAIVFFSTGDHQSMRRYQGSDNILVRGNLARIYYGPDSQLSNLLLRKQKIYIQVTDGDPYPSSMDSNSPPVEYESAYMSNWQKQLVDDGGLFDEWIDSPVIDLQEEDADDVEEDMAMLMAENVIEFAVQWYFIDPDSDREGFLRWIPQSDTITDELDWPNSSDWNEFPLPDDGKLALLPVDKSITGWSHETFYPRALKFTFTIKDSKDVFPEGRTFTHIVYLDH